MGSPDWLPPALRVTGAQTSSGLMMFYAGLDLSRKETLICVVDGAPRKAVNEVKVSTERETIAA